MKLESLPDLRSVHSALSQGMAADNEKYDSNHRKYRPILVSRQLLRVEGCNS
jgi:hypothetical protein